MKRGKGALIWLDRSQQWAWRGWVMLEGERVRKQLALGTTVRSVAKAKAARIVAGGIAPEEQASRPETFSEAAERIVNRQRDEGLVSWRIRMARIRNWINPVCGQVQVDKINADHIRDVLAAAHAAGLKKATLEHLRADCSVVMGELWRANAVAENVVAKVRVPRNAHVDDRRRIVPTDHELMQLIASGQVSPELQVAVLLARTIGGQRTSDLMAADWSRVDRANWKLFDVVRPKTGASDTHEIPDMTAPILESWWHASGKPASGPLFPVRKGSRQGERKIKVCWAGALRDALWIADVGRPASGSPSALEGRLRPSTGLSKEDCLLQTDTARTRRTGFHQIRRAYVTATHRVELDPAMQMRLASHASWAVHQGYIEAEQVLSLPDKALPSFAITESMTARIRMLNSTEAARG
jgi:integrase